MIMKNIFKAALILITLIFSSSSVLSQSNDKKANTIVKEMLTAMGGMKNYNATHFIQWDFVNRKLSWDKWTGDVRIENPTANQVILVNINTLKGKVYENGTLVKDEAKANGLLEKGKNWWINDSYWLVMPWKLQDPGVNLTYVKTDKLPSGTTVDILQLTFSAVGVTPENKYWLYVDKEDHLIKQWAYYKNFNDAEPKFLKPWNNYQKAGNILLSFDRPNEDVGPKNVIVKTNIDSSLFTAI
jgi:outer membrane lipoprotein-sorting protein